MLTVKAKDSLYVRTEHNTPRHQVTVLQNKHHMLTKWHRPVNRVDLSIPLQTSASKINLDLKAPWLLLRSGHVPIVQLTAGHFTLNQPRKETKGYSKESRT